MPAVTFARLSEEMLAIYSPPHRRPATLKKMRRALAELASAGCVKSVDLSPHLLTRWAAEHTDRKPISSASVLISIRAVCTYAKKMGYLRVSPWDIRKDWLPMEDDSEDEPVQVRHHSITQVRAVLDLAEREAAPGGWSEARLYALIATYAYTGLRKMEALGLKASDVDIAEGIISVKSRRRRRLKTRSSAAPVGIPAELAPIIDIWMRRSGSEWVFPGKRGVCPWVGGSPGHKPLDQIRALGDRAGVKGLTIKSFRHSLATHMKRWGCGPLAVKDQLRHGDVKTQSYYLENDLADLRETASKISYRTG
jgi:integrase